MAKHCEQKHEHEEHCYAKRKGRCQCGFEGCNDEKTRHTPTPWEQNGHFVESYGGPDVCEVGIKNEHGQHNNEEAEANAAFIVTAVNAHEELVKACQNTVEHLRSKLNTGLTVAKACGMQSVLVEIEQALAKAGIKI